MDSDSTAWKIQAKHRHFERNPFDFVWKLVNVISKLYYIALHLYGCTTVIILQY
jgi:hypothetical protein